MKIEISNGELLDKLSILEIKLEKIKDKSKYNNIKNEHDILFPLYNTLLENNHHVQFYKNIGIENNFLREKYQDLLAINKMLWDVEDKLRIKESLQAFDSEFISLARQVYINNDTRSKIKKDINIATSSYIIEEKSYC